MRPPQEKDPTDTAAEDAEMKNSQHQDADEEGVQINFSGIIHKSQLHVKVIHSEATSACACIAKIGEIVDAVNELRDAIGQVFKFLNQEETASAA